MLEGPSEEANDALAALAIIVNKTASDLPPICLTCARVFAHDLPAAVAIAKPFASQSGEMIVAAVCEDCLDHGREILIAKILERFRASGMRDARELKVGTARTARPAAQRRESMRKNRRKDLPIPHARNKALLAILMDMRREGLLQVDENGVWTATAAGAAKMSAQSKGRPH